MLNTKRFATVPALSTDKGIGLKEEIPQSLNPFDPANKNLIFKKVDSFKKSIIFVKSLTSNGIEYTPEIYLPHFLPIVEKLQSGSVGCGAILVSEQKRPKDGVLDPSVRTLIGLVQEKIGKRPRIILCAQSLIEQLWEVQCRAAIQSKGKTRSEFHVLLNEFVKNGLALNASDLHFEVRENGTACKQRVDGELEDCPESLSQQKGLEFIRYVYSMICKGTDIDFNPYVPQDGAATLTINNKRISFRLATIPDLDYCDMILRLIPIQENFKAMPLTVAGYTKKQAKCLLEGFARPFGLTMFSGSTGSGKSTSMINLLSLDKEQNEGKKKYITIENPPEKRINVTQIPVSGSDDGNPQWARAIKGCMRSDPDKLLVGEIRDRESAHLTMDIVLTGHPVLSTVHSGTGIGIVDRLEQLGIPKEILSAPSFIQSLVNQTLIRLNCKYCSISFEEAKKMLKHNKIIKNIQLLFPELELPTKNITFKGDGCSKCRNKGTSGRSVLAEVIVLDERMRRLVKEGDYLTLQNYFQTEYFEDTISYQGIVKISSGGFDPYIVGLATNYPDVILRMHKEKIQYEIQKVSQVV